MKNRGMTDAQILAQIPSARKRGRLARTLGRAMRARYSAVAGRLTIVLTNDARFSLPAKLAPDLGKATAAQLGKIRITPSGEGLLWPDIDADLSVAGMLEAMVGGKLPMSQLGRVGGLARSNAKASTSRSNGAKGGRPRVKKNQRCR